MINTNGVKYIGSKNKLIKYILPFTKKYLPDAKSVIDVFTGTTRVAQAYKKIGLKVTTSDLAWASEAYSKTFIANEQIPLMDKYIERYNNLSPIKGWLTEYYSGNDKNKSMVFQEKNTMRADAIRDQIEKDKRLLSVSAYFALITSLIFALDKVDNTVGVQQAYLKDWCIRSHKDMILTVPEYIDGIKGEHITGDALKIEYPQADIAYLDPPYSAHSYSTYYHIWDSITRWDKPEVTLKTNRRLDRAKENFDEEMRSEWNSKKTALEAFRKLLLRLPVENIILSYSDESLVDKEVLLELIESIDKNFIIEEIDYKRNIMSTIGNAVLYNKDFKTKNKELLILLKK